MRIFTPFYTTVPKMAKAFSRKQESPFWGHPHARKLHGLVPFSAKAFSRKQESPFWGPSHVGYALFGIMVTILQK